MSLIDIKNETFHYARSGPQGAPVVILSNSLGTSAGMWARQTEAFSQDFNVLNYDTRGHGRSVKNPGPYSIDQLGQDVLNLMDALDIEHAAFCGISMGGLIGQWLGVHASDRITKLVVCNTAAKIGTADAWLDRAAQVRQNGMGPIADSTPSRWFTQGYVDTGDSFINELLADLRTTDAEGYAACCEALAHADFREQLGKIRVPTLVIAGKHDPVTTVKDAEAIAQGIPGSTVKSVNASHLSNVEASDEFNTAVLQFLKG